MSTLYVPKKPAGTRRHRSPLVGGRTRVTLRRSIATVYATDFGNPNWRTLEAGRRRLVRLVRRARVKVRVLLSQPLTAKSKQARMGKGKGKLRGWTSYLRPGTPLYDVGLPTRAARTLSRSRHTRCTGHFEFERVSRKLAFGVKVVRRNFGEPRHRLARLRFRAPQRQLPRSRRTRRAFPTAVAVVDMLWRALERWEVSHRWPTTPLRRFAEPLLAGAPPAAADGGLRSHTDRKSVG